ncbi:MAG: dihydrofolate reductase family protein [Litorilinea sp.]
MGKVIVGMTMSLDGFVCDPSGSLTRLYADFDELRDSELLQEPIRTTGAVVMGRRTFAMADDPDMYADNYEFQVPIFVVTHQAPQQWPKQNDRLTFTFVTDGIETAIVQAKAAAGEKDVTVVGGPDVIRQCLQFGLADELHIDIMPVLLGRGLRLFAQPHDPPVELEKIKVVETRTRTGLLFRIIHPS